MMKTEKQSAIGRDLTQGNILKELIYLVMPLVLTNFIQQLYGVVDVMVIGKFVGTHGTSGVSTGGEVCSLLTFMATSFGSAGQIYAAQLYGAGRRQEVGEVFGTALTTMVGFAILGALVSIGGCNVFLRWLNCPAEALEQARAYMLIVSVGLPFVFGYNAICGILRGIGETKRPLLFITVAAVSNIVMDLLLVVAVHMEAAGTAIATVIAQMASFLAAAIFLYRKREEIGFSFRLEGFAVRAGHLKMLLKLGLPLTASTVFIHFSQMICISNINSFGLVASATNSIGNNVNKIINIFSSSINGGTGAMVGQNLGAKKYDRVKKIVYTTVALSAVFALIAIFIALFLPRQAFALFTDDPEVIEAGVTFMRIAIIIFALVPIHGSFNSVITAGGHVWLGFTAGLLDGMVLRLGISYALAYGFHMGVEGFFYGNALARLAPVVIGLVFFYSGRWKKSDLLQSTGEPA